MFGKYCRLVLGLWYSVYASAGPDPHVPLNLESGSECTDLSVL